MTTKKYGPTGQTLAKLINEYFDDVYTRRQLFLTKLQAYGVTSGDLSGPINGIPLPLSYGIGNELRDREKGIK